MDRSLRRGCADPAFDTVLGARCHVTPDVPNMLDVSLCGPMTLSCCLGHDLEASVLRSRTRGFRLFYVAGSAVRTSALGLSCIQVRR